MKNRIRFLSLLLTSCIIFGSTSTIVFAKEDLGTAKAIQLGIGQIEGMQADSIYLGAYQQSNDGNGGYNKDSVKWQVLSNEEDKLFLFADTILDIKDYNDEKDETPDRNIYWSECSLREWLNDEFINTAFSENENMAISQTVITTPKFDIPNGSSQEVGSTGDEETTDKVFLLSVNDVKNDAYFQGEWTGGQFGSGKKSFLPSYTTDYVKGITGSEGNHYWLRDPGKSYETGKYSEQFTHFDSAAEILYGTGTVFDSGLEVSLVSQGHTYAGGIRPAFNMDASKILLTSAAVNGKTTGTMGTLSSVPDYTGNEWKLTLIDSNRSSFTVDASEAETSAEVGYSNWSIPVAYSGAQTGDNEYVSALLCDNAGNVLYYGNLAQSSESGTVRLNIPSGLADGSYTLKVFSEQCNGDYKTDYASAFQDISLTVILPRETTPQATFSATGDNGGTLSNVEPGMKYSTDGGANWNDITGTTIDLTGVTAENDVKVYKPGDGTTTSDSDIQTIDVTQAAQPAVSGVDCTTVEQNDGKLTGVDSTMEYRLSTASKWTEITDTEVTGLADGTYEVRVKANGTVLASTAATVTIGEHTCAAQGGWQSDADGHWKLCTCGAELDSAAHTFVWVTDKEATAAETGSRHEECTVCGYQKAAVEIPATGTAEEPSEPSADSDTAAGGSQSGNISSPQTGDDCGIALWITVMLISGMTLIGAILCCHRKKYRG